MTELYLITFLEDEINPDLYMDYISSDRKQRILRCINKETAIARLIAGLLSRYLAHIRLGLANKDIHFSLTEKHKPFLTGHDFHFNISHSGSHVVVAVSEKELGVDIEEIDSRMDILAVAERFFSTEEYNTIKRRKGKDRIEMFYRIWSLKESYIKAIGDGLSKPLNSFSIISDESGEVMLRDTLLHRDALQCVSTIKIPWIFREYEYRECKIALCSQIAPAPDEIIVLDVHSFLNDVRKMGTAV